MLETLISDIYEAALKPEHWTHTARCLREHFEAAGVLIFTPETHRTAESLAIADNLDLEFAARYRQEWHGQDVWAEAGVSQGLVHAHNQALGEQLVPRRTLLATPFFNEFLKPQDIQGLAATILFDERDASESPPIRLILHTAVGRPEFEKPVLDQVRTLVPHFRRALAIHWRLQNLSRESQLGQSILDALPHALLLLDRTGGIVTFNRKGGELLRTPGILSVRCGRLMALGARSTPTLAEALVRADTGMGTNIAFLGTESKGEGAWLARITPVRPDDRFAAGWPLAARLVIIEAPEPPDPNALASLAGLYRLTPAEQQVLSLLIQDLTPAEIAESLRIGIATVRTHLQKLREKTGTRRQAELVRITLGTLRR